MEVQCYNTKALQEGSLGTTFVSWDEFRKLAKVGDTIREPSRTLVITEKTFELTASGDQFAIQIYAR
jgi:hypothetical protein